MIGEEAMEYRSVWWSMSEERRRDFENQRKILGELMGKKKKYIDQMSLYAQASVIDEWSNRDSKTGSTTLHEMAEKFKGVNWYGDEMDPVKHPSHYTEQVPGIECKDVIGWFPGHIASAMKYLWRYRSKGRPIEDLRKAIEFINFEIERLEKLGGGDYGGTSTDGPSREDETPGSSV